MRPPRGNAFPPPRFRAFLCCVQESERHPLNGRVTAVSRSAMHTMAKANEQTIRLLEGLGVEGDAHAGTTVKHRSRVRQDPSRPNLRQVHLIHAELHDELRGKGFDLSPGQMGENITTWGIDLLGLPKGARLCIGADAVVEVTGLRNPCTQLDGLQAGLMGEVLDRDEQGAIIRKAGIMGIVVNGGEVKPGDAITVLLPEPPFTALDRV